IRFMLPSTVAPRYAPAEDQRGVSPTPAERVTPPVELDVPYGLQLDVNIELGSPVRAVESPSHPVRFTLDGPRAHVALSADVAAMDRDFVLFVREQERPTARVGVERNRDGLFTVAVCVVPQLPVATGPREVVFVVDRSGSMIGTSIDQVRAALHLCLRALREGDRFNIVGFGSTFSMLFPESVPYTQATLEKASAHVDGMNADMGGTEILPALRAVLEAKPAPGRVRDLVLLTDGEVSNEGAVIELAGTHRDDTRIFTFGIGYGASEHLVRAVARVTMGEAEFIHPGERIEPKVLRQFARLGTPALRDVKVDVQRADVTLQAPHQPGGAFNGEALLLYARFRADGPVIVTLGGRANGEPVSWSVPVDTTGAKDGDLLATLAARAAIRDLEEGTSALHVKQGGSAQPGRRAERIRKAIVALATEYHLASSETSFVAIERRDASGNQPAAELRRVPVALTAGYGGAVPRVTPMLQNVRAAGAPTRAAMAPVLSTLSRAAAWLDADADVEHRGTADVRPLSPAFDQMSAPQSYGPHVALARLQQADGSWRADDKLANAIGVDLRALRAVARGIEPTKAAEALVATLAALRFLETRAAEAEIEWRLLAQKAVAWLARTVPSFEPDVVDELRARVAQLIQEG
ncbi:MAG: VWA domain-containing protein, partial [Bacteroidales bacterium]